MTYWEIWFDERSKKKIASTSNVYECRNQKCCFILVHLLVHVYLIINELLKSRNEKPNPLLEVYTSRCFRLYRPKTYSLPERGRVGPEGLPGKNGPKKGYPGGSSRRKKRGPVGKQLFLLYRPPLASQGIHTPAILDFDRDLGIFLLEDFGDVTLEDWINTKNSDLIRDLQRNTKASGEYPGEGFPRL